MSFVVVPVVFRESELADLSRRPSQQRLQADSLHRLGRLEAGDVEHCRGQVDDTHQAVARPAGSLDPGRPVSDQSRLHSRVVDPRLGSRERAAVVGQDEDQRVVQLALRFQFGHDLTNVIVEASHLVVVRGEVLPGFLIVDQKGRHDDIGRFVHRPVALLVPLFVGVPVAVGVVRSEPEEKRFVLRSVFRHGDPVRVAAAVSFRPTAVDMVKRFRSSFSLWPFGRGHVMFAAEGRVVARLAEQFGKPRQVPLDRQMQLGGLPVVVRVAARDDARTARTAAARRQVCVVKSKPVRGESVNVRSPRRFVPVAAVVVPADVISDEENDVRLFGRAG